MAEAIDPKEAEKLRLAGAIFGGWLVDLLVMSLKRCVFSFCKKWGE